MYVIVVLQTVDFDYSMARVVRVDIRKSEIFFLSTRDCQRLRSTGKNNGLCIKCPEKSGCFKDMLCCCFYCVEKCGFGSEHVFKEGFFDLV